MEPFAAALDALFNAPGSAAAIYVPANRGDIELRVIERLRMGSEGTVRPRPVALGKVLEIRVSDVEQPQVGDVILLADRAFALVTPPELDPERITWICDIPALERTLEILGPTRVENAYGDIEDGFGPIATLAAARLDHAGTEAEDIDVRQTGAWQTATFFIPWNDAFATITPVYQLRENGRTFDIQQIAEVGNHVALEITAIAKVA